MTARPRPVLDAELERLIAEMKDKAFTHAEQITHSDLTIDEVRRRNSMIGYLTAMLTGSLAFIDRGQPETAARLIRKVIEELTSKPAPTPNAKGPTDAKRDEE